MYFFTIMFKANRTAEIYLSENCDLKKIILSSRDIFKE